MKTRLYLYPALMVFGLGAAVLSAGASATTGVRAAEDAAEANFVLTVTAPRLSSMSSARPPVIEDRVVDPVLHNIVDPGQSSALSADSARNLEVALAKALENSLEGVELYLHVD